MDKVQIRKAEAGDAKNILSVYSYYVEHTAISFEHDVPTVAEFQKRIERTLAKYPYLVAVRDGKIVGYSYAGPFVGRAAYDWSAELTIYLNPEEKGHGTGRKLYETAGFEEVSGFVALTSELLLLRPAPVFTSFWPCHKTTSLHKS